MQQTSAAEPAVNAIAYPGKVTDLGGRMNAVCDGVSPMYAKLYSAEVR